ncbi:MAG TPA: cardiolipin synthase ClsB [Novimethylophilus sp.]|jgi:cardiolipin synthase|uniref:cardiolipin synthase ClsB n=1 Tax=Novimethylophilus sp. TaxID=2137426 RepID=UPI002F417247
MTDFVPNNLITLLRNGADYFPALERAIDGAQVEIHLQTYIFEDDGIGRRVAAALIRAAQRGVTVCVLLDGFGCKDTPKTLIVEMQRSGVEVLFYRPKISPWTLKRNRLRRLHRKIAVVDGKIAFIGGINIIDDMNTPGHTPPRVDYAVCVQGPLLKSIEASARRLWRRIAWARLRSVKPSKPTPSALVVRGNMWAAYVVRDNALHRHDIEEAYLAAIEAAYDEIIIANAYFLPGRDFRRALISAAHRGVRVVLLLQGRVEYWLLHYASRALYREFLDAGIEIHEYHKSFMHSKVAVVDRRWATIGSSNIDPMSLWLAREANIVVDDQDFAMQLRDDLEQAIQKGARLIRLDDWNHTSILRRSTTWFIYNLVRLAMGLIGFPDKA